MEAHIRKRNMVDHQRLVTTIRLFLHLRRRLQFLGEVTLLRLSLVMQRVQLVPMIVRSLHSR